MARIFKIALRILIGVAISCALTVALVMFTPSIFNKALNLWIDLLPSYKFIHYEVQSKQQLAQDFNLDPTDDDAILFNSIKSTLPDVKDKSSLFFRFLSVHAYPETCRFTLIGMHRTIDVTWRVEGLRCKSKESCELARTQNICPDKKRHD